MHARASCKLKYTWLFEFFSDPLQIDFSLFVSLCVFVCVCVNVCVNLCVGGGNGVDIRNLKAAAPAHTHTRARARTHTNNKFDFIVLIN